MPYSRRGRDSTINIWPGFVDALTQLTMVIVFVLLVFTVGQFYLSGTVSSQDEAIHKLTQQISQLNEMLGVETSGNATLKSTIASLSKQLEQATSERDSLQAQVNGDAGKLDEAQKGLSERDTQIATLNQNIDALRQQLTDISAALDLAKTQNKTLQAQVDDLGNKLNVAMANKLEELARYRSEFFGQLRAILGDRPDIRVVGDRFVFQSEVLFAEGSAELTPEAQKKLEPVVTALKEISGKIPADIAWVLEVDGHTDKRPINTARFHSNWELSTARAVSVLNFLAQAGIPSTHLAAAGYGEFQPLDSADTEEALHHNRRIELKLTQR